MRFYKLLFALALCGVLWSASGASAQTWTFETLPDSPPPTPGQLERITDGGGTPIVGEPAAGGGGNLDLVSWDSVDGRWEFVSRRGTTAPPVDPDPVVDAARVSFDPTGSPLSATNLQEALAEAALIVGGGSLTNITVTPSPTSVAIDSSDGTDDLLPLATTVNAGAMAPGDKTKLDGVEAAATADQTGAEILSAWESETGRTVAADSAKLDSLEAPLVVVDSFAELETYFRSIDTGPRNASSVTQTANVVFGPNFTSDRSSTDPFVINLPVSGAEHPRINIDLGGHVIANEATSVLQINFGNVNGECLDDDFLGYHEDVVDCLGVAHDYEVRIKNGMVTSLITTGCTPIPTSCGRTAIELVNDDRLFSTSGNSRYSGRVYIEDVTLGGQVDGDAGGTDYAQLNFVDDACLSVGGWLATLNVKRSFFQCFHGVTVRALSTNGDPDEPGTAGNGMRTSLEQVYYFSNTFLNTDGSGKCWTCHEGGFFNVLEPMAAASVTGDLFIAGGGTLGQTRGGTFDLAVSGSHPGMFNVVPTPAFSLCYDENDIDAESAFLNNSKNGTNTDYLKGRITFVGQMCVQSWLISDAVGEVIFDAILSGPNYPAFYYDDATDTTRTGYPLSASASANFTGAATFNFRFQDALTADPTTSHDGGTGIAWDDIVDPQINDGTVFDNDFEYVTFQMGARGIRTDSGTSGTNTITPGPIYHP